MKRKLIIEIDSDSDNMAIQNGLNGMELIYVKDYLTTLCRINLVNQLSEPDEEEIENG